MARCEECSHRYQIQQPDVEHQVMLPSERQQHNPLVLTLSLEGGATTSAAVATATAAPVSSNAAVAAALTSASAGATTATAAPPRPAAPSAARGVSPVDPGPLQPPQPAFSPDFSALSRSSPNKQRLSERLRRRRRKQQFIMLLGTGATFILVGVVAVLIYQALRDTPASTAPQQPAAQPKFPPRPDPDPGPGDLAPIPQTSNLPAWALAGVPRFNVQALPAPAWQKVDEPFAGSAHGGKLRLLDAKPVSANGQVVFRAKIMATSFDPIVQASVRLLLIGDNSQIYAAANIPLLLVQQSEAQNLSLPIPADMYQKMVQYDWSAKIDHTLLGGLRLIDLQTRIARHNDKLFLEVSGYNRTNQALHGTIFAIRAVDGEEMAVRQYRVDWPETIEADKRIVFLVVFDHEAVLQGVTWSASGVGKPLEETQP